MIIIGDSSDASRANKASRQRRAARNRMRAAVECALPGENWGKAYNENKYTRMRVTRPVNTGGITRHRVLFRESADAATRTWPARSISNSIIERKSLSERAADLSTMTSENPRAIFVASPFSRRLCTTVTLCSRYLDTMHPRARGAQGRNGTRSRSPYVRSLLFRAAASHV